MNIVVTTKGEWQAFELVLECRRQMTPADRLLVWDDFSPEIWVEQMQDLAEVKQDVCRPNIAEHRNRVKAQFQPEEWILMIDADERIQKGFIAAVDRETRIHPEADAIYLERHNSIWEGRMDVVPPSSVPLHMEDHDWQSRGFRNRPQIEYEGPIHHVLKGYKHPLFLSGYPFTLIHHRKNCLRGYESFVPNYPEYVTLCKSH